MKIIATAANKLAKYAPAVESAKWQLVHSGNWSQSPWHNGHIAYYVTCLPDNTWVMKSVERNTMLDDVTEEDVEEGNLNDDQIQAMWGMSLEEAQDQVCEEIVAVCLDAPNGVDVARLARRMYLALLDADGAKQIDEPDSHRGLASRLDFDIALDDAQEQDNGCFGDEASIEYECRDATDEEQEDEEYETDEEDEDDEEVEDEEIEEEEEDEDWMDGEGEEALCPFCDSPNACEHLLFIFEPEQDYGYPGSDDLRALVRAAPSFESLIEWLTKAGAEMASGWSGDSSYPGGESFQEVYYAKDPKATLEKAWQLSGLPRPKEPSP